MSTKYSSTPVTNGVHSTEEATPQTSGTFDIASILASFPPHPTRSTTFLKPHFLGDPAQPSDDATKTPLQAKNPLEIVIVGAGLCGLSASIALALRGHKIVILEQSSQLTEVGAGVQIPPNSSRLLIRWGVDKHLKDVVVEPRSMIWRRWEDGSVIGLTKVKSEYEGSNEKEKEQWEGEFKRDFGAPHWVVHRAHFHEALHARAKELGVEIRVNSKVVEVDIDAPSLKLADDSVVKADLIVGCDGVNSIVRDYVPYGKDLAPRPFGLAAFRATVDTAKFKDHPELAKILEGNSLNLWVGDNKHVMAYQIGSGKSLNIVASHFDPTDPNTWTAEEALKQFPKTYEGWDPALVKIISMVDSTLKWPMLCGYELPSWTPPNSKVVVLGDAAHAMLPYMAQGAAMAVEDAAALATALSISDNSKNATADTIHTTLHIFGAERRNRTARMQGASLMMGLIIHYPDGPEQEARDRSMRPEVEGKTFNWSANQWSDPVTQWWSYGFDAEERMETVLNSYFQERGHTGVYSS